MVAIIWQVNNMANEASTAIVARFKNEASAGMEKLGGDMERVGNKAQATSQSFNQVSNQTLQMSVAAMAGAQVLGQFSALLGQMDSEGAKTAARILQVGNYIITTTVAITSFLPMIKQMITQLRTLAATQAIIKALSGPAGIIGLGLGVGALAGLGVASAMGGSNQSVTERSITINNNVSGSVITERQLGDVVRREIIKSGDRNNSSGVR